MYCISIHLSIYAASSGKLHQSANNFPSTSSAVAAASAEAKLATEVKAGLAASSAGTGLIAHADAGLAASAQAGLSTHEVAGLGVSVKFGLVAHVDAGLAASVEFGLVAHVEAGLGAVSSVKAGLRAVLLPLFLLYFFVMFVQKVCSRISS